MRRFLLILVICVIHVLPIMAQQTGDLSFLYFNKEEDEFTLVTWVDLEPNKVLYIRDDKRASGAFTKTTSFTWNTGAAIIPAGTIIKFTKTPTVSIGTVTMTAGLGIGNEPLWCFTGVDENTPTTFLAAIGNGADDASAFGDLSGTGLVVGQSAIRLMDDVDRAQYTGARGGLSFAEYKVLANDVTKWEQKLATESWLGSMSTTPAFSQSVVTVPAKLSFMKDYTIVKEDAANVSIGVKISGSNTAASSVTVQYMNNGALVSEVITFAAGTPDNTVQSLNVAITHNTTPQNDRYLSLEMKAFTNAEPGSIGNHVLFVQDLEKKGPIATKAIELQHAGSFKIPGIGTAEIVAYDSASQNLYALNSTQSTVEVLDFSNTHKISHVKTLSMAAYGKGATSVAVKNGIVAASVTNDAEANGYVVFFSTDGTFLNKIEVGNLPDMITFTPDGKYVLTANEGQPNDDYTVDPEGSISLIDITGGITNLTQNKVSTITFHAFDASRDQLRTQGIRIYGANNPSVSQDFEPEYITLSKDSRKAWVTLQENNAIAEIDLVTKSVTKIHPLGLKDYLAASNTFDPSDKTTSTTFGNFPVKGMYQPDAIANFTINGTPYLLTANEGDDRAYGDFEEKVRLKDASYVLDKTVFPNADLLKKDHMLGRLQVTNASGDVDGDGDFDEIHALGARSFSIWNGTTGQQVFDSGDDLERMLANDPIYGPTFNSNSEPDGGKIENLYKNRSDDKGPEPEGITTALINGRQYAFLALERMSGIVTYDVTDPGKASFVQYVSSRSANVGAAKGDLGPEGIIYISPAASPSDTALVVVANEHSATVSVYTIKNVVEKTVTSIESPAENKLSVYPNPANSTEVYFTEAISYQLLTAQGVTLREGNNATHEYVGDLANGLYLIRTDTGKTIKIIVKR